jgi:hypothetical protein
VATAAGLHSNGGFGALRVDKAARLSALREFALANLGGWVGWKTAQRFPRIDDLG